MSKITQNTTDLRAILQAVNNLPEAGGGEPNLGEKVVTENGSYSASDEGLDGYSKVEVNVESEGGAPFYTTSVESDTEILAENVISIGTAMSVTAETYATHFLYNEVRLPRISEDLLEQYPYAWIRLNSDGVKYDLLLGKNPWYYKSTMRMPSAEYIWYFVRTANDATWSIWNSATSGEGNLDTGAGLVWSNHDIPNGSATATDIYFEGTEPVPAE